MPETITIPAGGLSFKIEYRFFGGDRGPAIRVFAHVNGEAVQALRFDCFRDDPHYHYDPSGNNEMHHLDKEEVPCPVGWSLEQINTRVKEMIEHAGFADAAAAVDQEAITAVTDEIKNALRQVSPARIGLQSIQHNSVIISKPEEARAFYSGILGLKEVKYPSTFPNPVIWYELGDQQIHLMIKDEPDSISSRHVALQIRDAVKARIELEAKGVKIDETIPIPGADRFYIHDPDGNMIELIEWQVPWGEGPM
jgi:catechol 2,3-dioxygenase-like lactoylglutathione lyase family enzyme